MTKINATTTNAGEVVRTREPSFTVVGIASWGSLYGNHHRTLIKAKIIQHKTNTFPWHVSKGLDPTDTYLAMCIDALFTIGRKRKQPKCPSVEE